MNTDFSPLVARELGIRTDQVKQTADLLSEGCTVPFIARYRKEATGSLDEVAISAIRNRLSQMAELKKRRNSILNSLTEREILTPELEEALKKAMNMSQLEDIYLPYRPKKRTRASIAKEKGLSPLADLILKQEDIDPEKEAGTFINPEKGINSVSEALAGASDIIAEQISETREARSRIRKIFAIRGHVSSGCVKGKEEEGEKYSDYYDYSGQARGCPSHRILAMLRGEKEGFLKLSFLPREEKAISTLRDLFISGNGKDSEFVMGSLKDSYKRLLAPSMENELKSALKNLADKKAIQVFADNIREILMSPPLGKKRVLALDPGFRTGCKVVCLGAEGQLLHNDTIYPHPPQVQKENAARIIRKMVDDFQIEAIAIGNGTAGRETKSFIDTLDLPKGIVVVMVNESGASVYSASKVAREEFPEEDVTVRGSVSIGRRLVDPLAELVKIDPKSIGVGQYQHDVDQKMLKQSLDDVVQECVNRVGVDVNTASKQLLSYISGLGPQLASNIVSFRETNGLFMSRMELKKVPRLGPKAFEQAAGFLRIRDGKNPLDESAVHPENYGIVASMAKEIGCSIKELVGKDDLKKNLDLKKYMTQQVGLPTLNDILDELARPGRDPRNDFDLFNYSEEIQEIEDLSEGMILPGVVSNVTAFGAFVDIGVHQDGLVHISELSDSFIKDPNRVVKPSQKVIVKVMHIDIKRKRISLSMKGIKQDKGDHK